MQLEIRARCPKCQKEEEEKIKKNKTDDLGRNTDEPSLGSVDSYLVYD